MNPVYSVMYSRVQVLRRLSLEEAEAMRTEEGVTKVEPYAEISHYFGDCGGQARNALSRSLSDTTCLACLQERANQLTGWRWRELSNAEDVEYLKSCGIWPAEVTQ